MSVLFFGYFLSFIILDMNNKYIKCSSAPIKISEDIIKMNKIIHPKEIIEYDKTAPIKFIFRCPVNDLINFKIRNAMINDKLKNNPTLDIVMDEYKNTYIQALRREFNKLTINNIEETVNFIKVNSNNILSEEEMNNFTIDIIKDNLKNKMKVPIIKAHLALIQELQNILNYNFNFVFDKKFLKSFILDEEQYNIFPDIVNNIIVLITLMYENKIINDKAVYVFFDNYIAEPELLFNMSFTSFCKSVINSIHGLPCADINFKPSPLFKVFKKYIKERKLNLIKKYKEFSADKEKTFLLTMLIEIFEKAEQDEF